MKKIMKKMKGKKVLSLVLAAIMLATTFNMALPMLKLDASAAGSITTSGGETITQTKIVDETTRYTTYDSYAAQFLNGASSPTNIVIPGLATAEDYVIQGMTYYPQRDWMLITAYHNADTDNGETAQPSKAFALDAATGEFVAMFSFLNPDGTANTEHGGGIAVSENNIYYACGDDDRQIAYAPLSYLENAVVGEHTVVQLADMVEFNEIGSITSDSKTAYTAYVCFDDGVLWTGNFYDPGVTILGMSVAATDYSVPANNDYNSMVFGYRLAGSSSEEEWNYLMGNVTGKDCRGNPSYVIGLNNTIKDVQYAVVDNGKLYLSCSFGTGEGTNSVSLGGMNPYSTLYVADIDLSQPGTRSTDIVTHNGTRTVKAYDIQTYKKFDMMPMSEGLCVINDQIFITFESASNKYLNEAGTFTGNCNHPVDVVWQLDPYELMETTVAEPEKSIYYEKVHSNEDIIDGEEYIIVHESNVKDPVSQKNYLYALNAKGNFKGFELSKSSATNIYGYDGMIGHPISYYSFEKGINGEDILYLEHPEDDDIADIRWTISKISGTDTRYNIKNTSTYFANYNNLYFNQSKITMSPSGAGYLSEIDIGQLDDYVGNGYFYLSNNLNYYLWSNDGLIDDYNTKANAYYTNNLATYPLLDGVTEVAGTFHCDALNVSGANILGGAIVTSDDDPNIPYEDGAFQIYRRVVDGVSSTYESRVYTDLGAELQEDGTYTVSLETYAISPNHYQYVGQRPTDYIIVADTSSSMGEKGSTGIQSFTGSSDSLSVASMSVEADTADDRGKGNANIVIGYGFSNEDIYFKHAADGQYYKGLMAIRNVFSGSSYDSLDQQFYYVYYIADDGYYYCYTNQEGTPSLKYTEDEFKAWVAGTNGVLQTASSTRGNNNSGITGDGRRDEVLFTGPHYRFDDINSEFSDEYVRLDTLKTTVNDLIDDIAAQNSDNRIALVQYGGTNGFYNTSGTFTTDDYANAFWSTSAKDTLKTTVSALSTSTQTDGTGIELTYADNIIRSSGIDYKSDGTKNLAIIFLSDGIPGTETTSTDCDGNISSVTSTSDVATTAANGVIAKAQTIKDYGAFIYTVLIGNEDVDGFSKKTYMDAVSSKYAAAKSMTELGGQSVDGINYSVSLATTTIENYLNFGAMTTEEVKQNASVGLDNLDKDSYLREQLSDAFKFPADFNPDEDVKVELVTGAFDEVGRFSFKESQADIEANAADAANIVTETNTESKTLTITNYNYSEEYVAKSRTTPGRKLRVTITGLLADETADIQNTSINNIATSAIYKTKTDMEGSDGTTDLSFKKLPTTYFNIPKYTYVLDYGLQLLDTDVNGTLKSVSADLSAQRDANGDISYKTESENKLVAIQDGAQNLLYHTTPTNATDSGYVLIQRDDGTYDWFEIEVVPASNVYFEESEMAVKDASSTTKAAWSDTGSSKYTNRDLPAEDDVDGFDNAYNEQSDYSNGTTRTVTVDSTTKNSQTQTFDFVGTGIDIVSRCGSTTGMMLITVKQEVDDGNGGTKMKTVKASIVDTYCAEGTFNQTPIFSWSGDYGTYTVEIGAMYLTSAGALNAKATNKSSLIDTGLDMTTSEAFDAAVLQDMLDEAGVEDVSADEVDLIWFDDNSIFNGGSGVAPTKKGSRADGTSTVNLVNYIDGFRVYNPLGKDADADASYKDFEQNVSYANVIDNLAPVSSTDGSAIDELYGIAYITGLGENETTVSFAKYQQAGPKGELYLNGGKAISFKINRGENERVMLGLRAANGTEATNVSINDGTGDAMSVNITSATEMYYDITNCIDSTGDVIITITNNHKTNLLAVNHVKFSGGSGSNGTVVTPRSMARSADASEATTNKFLPITQEDLVTIEKSMSAEPIPAVVKNGVIVPLVEEEETPGDTTTPDTGDDNVNNDTNDDTNTDSGDEDFSIFSLLELLIALIEKILHNAFGTGNLF